MYYIPHFTLLYGRFIDIEHVKIVFSIQGDKGQMEGSVSQIFYLGPSFYFIQSRKIILKK